MEIKENLQILIITYNRVHKLERTLKSLLDQSSPIREVPIVVIDNASTDGTKALCERYANQYNNVSYQRNRRNVGLSGNICRAFEFADKKYMWVIADDDTFNFEAWPEIEQAMQEDYDLILTCRMYISETEKNLKAITINQVTFLPSAIYKTSFLTPDVMSYAMLDTYTILPHVCLGCSIINQNGRIFLPSKSIVTIGREEKIDCNTHTHDRVTSNSNALKHSHSSIFNFYCGLALSLDALKDEKLRLEAFTNMVAPGRLNGYASMIGAHVIYHAFLAGKTTIPQVFMVYMRAPEFFRKELDAKFEKIFNFTGIDYKDVSILSLFLKKWQYKITFLFLSGVERQRYKDLYCEVKRTIEFIQKEKKK